MRPTKPKGHFQETTSVKNNEQANSISKEDNSCKVRSLVLKPEKISFRNYKDLPSYKSPLCSSRMIFIYS